MDNNFGRQGQHLYSVPMVGRDSLSRRPSKRRTDKAVRPYLLKIASCEIIAAVLFFTTALLSIAAENTPPADDASIVEVIATCQEYDSQLPWRKKPPQTRQGVGVVVDGNYVLTYEGVVRNNTLVEVRRARSGSKLEAKVREDDEQIHTALLKLSDQESAGQLKSVPIADKIKRNDTVTIVKMDASGQFQRAEGQVVEVVSSSRGLVLKVLTDLSVEQNGTPVFLGGALAGIVISYDKSAQTCSVLSGTSLKKFLADAAEAPYDGVAWAGLQWEPLLDPAKRKYLGLNEKEGGIIVINTVPGAGAAEVLQAEDVITEWDGFKLDELGYYTDPDYGRLLLSYLINGRRVPGDKSSLTVLRNRQKINLQLLLKRQKDRAQIIPDNTSGEQNEYLVEGGLLLRELSGDYLRASGHDWVAHTHPRLSFYYFNPWQFSRTEGDHIVILSGVLPDKINVGYMEYRDEIVTAVNGRPVRRLADVFAAVDRDQGLKRVSMKGYGVDLVLDEKELAEANRRIAATYRIPSLRYQRAPADEK